MGLPKSREELLETISNLKKICLGLSFIAAICLLVPIPSNNWFTSNTINIGLWFKCINENPSVTTKSKAAQIIATTSSQKKSDCSVTDDVWAHICGAFVVVTSVCSILGLMLTVIGFRQKTFLNRFKFYKAASFSFFSGVILIAGALILQPALFVSEANEREDQSWFFGWAYVVAWVGACALFSATVGLIVVHNKEEAIYREKLYLNEIDEDMMATP